MDLDPLSSPSEGAGVKTSFHKPSNDSANRNYRRRSPVSSSSSSDGGHTRERSSTPVPSRDDCAKLDDNQQRKDDRRDIDRDHKRSHHNRDGGSYRIADRTSRSSYNHRRHEDYKRREKYAEDIHKLSPRTRGGSGGSHGSYSDHARRESEQNRSRGNADKYSCDKSDGSGHRRRDKEREALSLDYQKKHKDSSSDRGGSGRRQTNFKGEEGDKQKRDSDIRDEKRDYPRTSRDRKSERSATFEEPRGHRAGHHLKEASWTDSKELDDPKYNKVDKGKHYDRETSTCKGRNKEPRELLDDRSFVGRNNQESFSKKPKLYSTDKDTSYSKDANEVQSSSSKQVEDSVGKTNVGQESLKESDIDAAKIAAMKAAELVNRNLVGTGFMSTDQKKKLLWGSKKSTAPEETAHRWDASMFSDRERQEKFKKLMGVKGEQKAEGQGEGEGGSNLVKKQEELQLDLEKQYTAGLRRRDGRTVGLGL